MSGPQQSPPNAESQTHVLVATLYFGGGMAIIAGVVLGLLVSPVLFVVALVGVADFVLARMFAQGKIGPLAARRKAAESGDAAAVAEADPSFNPYARED